MSNEPKLPTWPWKISLVMALQTQHGETVDDGAFVDIVDAWSEYDIEGNTKGWDDRLAEIRAMEHYGNVRVFDVTLDHDTISSTLEGAVDLGVVEAVANDE